MGVLTHEIIGHDLPMRSIDHGIFSIVIERGKAVIGFMVVKNPSWASRELLRALVIKFEECYSGVEKRTETSR